MSARNASFKVSSSDDEDFQAAIAESLLSQAPHSQMRTNDSFHSPGIPLSFLVLTSPLHGLETVTCMTLLHPDDATRAKELREGSRKGSRYGQFFLGYLLEKGPDARL